MSFLTPLFFAGLAALAVPVLIHLINRERREVVEFPSLMFLQRIPYRSVRRQKLRHVFLLLMRCLALAILVAAFARPFVRRPAVARAAGTGAREVVVLVDRSYSMGAGDHWTRAQEAARRAVSSLGPTDRATVIAFDNEASALTPPTADRATLTSAIGALRPGSEGTRYAPALKLASQILAGSNLPRREVVLVTDFQRLGWTPQDEISVPKGTTLTTVDVAAADSALPDAAVANVTVQRTEGARDRATVAARLTNTGPSPIDGDATLELNGRIAETKHTTVPPHGASQVRFSPTAIPSGTSAGIVRLAVADARRNRLPADDRYYFTVAADAGVSVLLVEPSTGRPNQSLYLTRALDIGDDPSFRVDVRKVGGVTAADLAGRSLVIFDEVAPPSGDLARRLHDFVNDGGGVLVVAGDALPEGAWNGAWGTALPGTIGSVVDRSGEAGGTLAWIDYDHPVFDLFNAPHSGDFATARFLRYRRITMHADSSARGGKPPVPDSVTGAHVLARFDDGGAALAEQRVGRGRVMVWASTLDNYWNDLALQPVFLPFVHQLAKYAGRYSGARPWFTAGEVLDLSRHAELSATRTENPVVVEAPSGAKTRLASGSQGLVPLDEQGFYEIRPEGMARGMGQRIAVNLDPAEANLARIDPQELKSAILASSGAVAGAAAADAPSREDTERRQTIWWYLLALAGILFATETLMSNRLSRRTS
jgi:aerotolerance regulator-like protein/VWA domain-containing protein